MNNLLPSSEFSMKPEKPDFVEPLKSVFFQYFEQLVDGCCARLDLEFALQLGKDREKINKDLYKKILEYLRSVRGDIKCNYLLKLNENFEQIDQKNVNRATDNINLKTASFASDDSVNEDHITNQIIRQCQQKHHEDLIRLNQLLAVLLAKTAIHPSKNPVAPENLLKALTKVIKPLKLSSLHRVALYKTFEENVFSQMGFVYHELIKQCESSINKINIEKRELVARPKRPTTAIEPFSVEFQQLQVKLTQWRNAQKPSVYDSLNKDSAHFFEHFEIQNALQILGQFSMTGSLCPTSENQPLKWHVIKRLEELNFSDEIRTLTTADEDVLDLISLIFARIAENPYLSDSFKSIIAPLMIPMSAVCLEQHDAFTSGDHPIRQVVDTLFATGLFLNPGTIISQSTQKWASGVISKILTAKGFEASIWTEAAKEITQFLEKQQENSRLLEAGSIQTMTEHEVLSENQRTVSSIIDDTIKNNYLPQTVIDFLKNTWKHVMLTNYLAKDQQPELWEKSVRTMNELIISVTPPEDNEQRKLILIGIPDLIKELRFGLSRISYDKALQSRFFKELAVLHVISLNNKEAKKSESQADKENTTPSGKFDTKPEKIKDSYTIQVNNLKIGDWLVFHLDDEKKWAKLARKGINDENLLFVDKNGERAIQIDVDGLAEQFRQGWTALTEPDYRRITDIILSELHASNALPYH